MAGEQVITENQFPDNIIIIISIVFIQMREILFLMSKLLLQHRASNFLPRPLASLFRRSCLTAGLASLLLGSLSVAQAAQSVSFAWTANTDPSIVGYRYHQGTSSGNYSQSIDVGKSSTATAANLTAGLTYYFVITAYNAAAQESVASNQVSFTATAAPTPTPTPMATPVPTPVATPTPKPTATPVATPKPTATPVATPKPTATPVATPKPTATPVATPKPTATPAPTPVATPSPTPAGTPSPTPVGSPSPSPTPSTAPTASLFNATDTPANVVWNDTNPVEMGVKFQTSVPGTVTAIRFYKGAKNIGTHTGNLWSSAGKSLGNVTFANETASGWQQAKLATPVSLTPGMTYTVSYHTNGFYSADASFFSQTLVKGPLTAAASTASAGNGVYAYGKTSIFPVASFQSTNYWVDVAFLPTTPQAPAPAIDIKAFGDQSSPSAAVTTSSFTTTSTNQLLLAYVATDYTSGANTTVTNVTGAGLQWVLVVRTNTQGGTAEIWRAFASSILTGVNVSASLSQSVASSLTVTTFKNVDTSGTSGSGAVGAIGTGNASAGAPTASLVTTRDNSLVVGVGNDYDSATARTVGTNQSLIHQNLAAVGDTYWVQMQNAPTPWSGTTVLINDTAPSADRFNLSLCEVLAAK